MPTSAPSAAPETTDTAGLATTGPAGPPIPRQQLSFPDAVAASGGDIWVADSGELSGGTDSVAELSAASGKTIRVLPAKRYGLNGPDAIAVDGSVVWVANGNGNSVTELDAATGGLVRVVSAARDGLDDPASIAAAGNGIWVANGGGSSVAEISTATGRLVRNVTPALVAGGNPGGSIAADGTSILMANWGMEGDRGWVAAFSAATGRMLWENDS